MLFVQFVKRVIWRMFQSELVFRQSFLYLSLHQSTTWVGGALCQILSFWLFSLSVFIYLYICPIYTYHSYTNYLLYLGIGLIILSQMLFQNHSSLSVHAFLEPISSPFLLSLLYLWNYSSLFLFIISLCVFSTPTSYKTVSNSLRYLLQFPFGKFLYTLAHIGISSNVSVSFYL